MYIPKKCSLCPRQCGMNRNTQPGVCRGGSKVKVAGSSPHFGEEKCISGTRGSGTVFFSGCSLGCVFCQNHKIRDSLVGRELTVEQLADVFLDLQSQKVHNINLVTPIHYRPWIQQALNIAKENGLSLPIVWNTSGYEKIESVEDLKDYVDIWLYDVKFYSQELSQELANAPDYFRRAFSALKIIHKNTGAPKFENGILKSGIIIRVLVLPDKTEDAIDILETIALFIPPEDLVLSLMRQYHPPVGLKLPEYLGRKLHDSEFEKVKNAAIGLGFSEEYFQ